MNVSVILLESGVIRITITEEVPLKIIIKE